MQVFTELPFTLDETQRTAYAWLDPDTVDHVTTESRQRATQPIWPDYFARRGQADATNWHYQGYATDCLHIWSSYCGFVLRHPLIAFHGLRHFFHSLMYRVFGEALGDRSGWLITLTTPLLMLCTPLLALAGVCIASIPALKKHMPPMFQPFTIMGWTNYCIMLALVFALHGYRQRQRHLHPAQAMRHSSKLFWNKFFAAELPAGHFSTEIHAVYQGGLRTGELPPADIVIKPVSSGAGFHLRSLRWDANVRQYLNRDVERTADEPLQFAPAELDRYLQNSRVAMLVERLEMVRTPLPISTLRILTLYIGDTAELICAAFLPAPAGSVSTAYFDLDIYLVDAVNKTIGAPLASRSDGKLAGIAIPEVDSVIETCLQLHEKLAEHVEISWDVMLTDRGPVYLEGNVFPPGCDYKLTLFKDPANFRYLCKRIIAADQRPQ